jgi:hypothetical protein
MTISIVTSVDLVVELHEAGLLRDETWNSGYCYMFR